ncbi:MAG: hypothetical protein WC055_01265 [Melioribacteraceae bacterium]
MHSKATNNVLLVFVFMLFATIVVGQEQVSNTIEIERKSAIDIIQNIKKKLLAEFPILEMEQQKLVLYIHEGKIKINAEIFINNAIEKSYMMIEPTMYKEFGNIYVRQS